MLGMGEIGVGQGEISISSTPIYIHFLLPPPVDGVPAFHANA
mgnify:CR=1 FL=1